MDGKPQAPPAITLRQLAIVGAENPGPLAPTSWWSGGDSNH
jgi:hypothetical protein